MADPVSPEVRSRIMSRVRGRDTRLELSFRRALWGAGVRGWRCNVRTVLGKPDLAWTGRKIAVFVDSAWWHGHRSRWKKGRHGEFWDRKIESNRRRDKVVTRSLEREGWTVIRIWDFELAQDQAACVARVTKALKAATPGKMSMS